MTGSSPLVSVVTPFFDTADYLAECIESVLAQDYGNFEYILVDNRSTDGSARIAEDYARRDERIRLLHNDEHLDQVANYNHALRQIGRASVYTKMVQADDRIYTGCLSRMVAVAEEHPSAKIVTAYRHRGRFVEGDGVAPDRPLVSGREACRMHLLGGPFLLGSPTTILLRSDVVRARDPFYAQGRLHEDTEAGYEILEDGDLGIVHQVLTFSRTQDESISGEVRGFNPDLLDMLILLRRFGRRFLTDEECRERSGRIERDYRRYLGEWFLRRRGGPGFWAYHEKGLATVGERLPSRWGLALRALLLDYLLCPRVLLAGLVRRLRVMK